MGPSGDLGLIGPGSSMFSDWTVKLSVSCFRDRPGHAPSPALVAMVNVFVLVTSVTPLTSFLHDVIVVKTSENDPGQQTQVRNQNLWEDPGR